MFQTNVDIPKRELGGRGNMPELWKCASVVATEAHFQNSSVFDDSTLFEEICLIHVDERQHSCETSF